MRKCPSCKEWGAAIQDGPSNKSFVMEEYSYRRRHFKCKACGYKYTTYEFVMDANQKKELFQLARLGRQFLEFKVEWKKAVLEEYALRKKQKEEYLVKRAEIMAARKGTQDIEENDFEEEYESEMEELIDESEELDNIIETEGEEQDE